PPFPTRRPSEPPRARGERPSAPKHHRSRQEPLNTRGKDAEHIADQNRRAEDGADYKAPAHVDELFVRPVLERRDSRLEGHAADGTEPGSVADDLRMHGAGVLHRPPGEWRVAGGGWGGFNGHT